METEHRIKEFIPKGGMCAGCKNHSDDCSHLDFESMPIISIELDEIIVRCTSYDAIKPTSDNARKEG